MLRSLAAALTLALAAGCLAPPESPAERLAGAAEAMNAAARFGRTNMALELVATPAQGEFTRRREPWGRDVWIVDHEVLDVAIVAQDEARVVVSVAWQRPNEASLRITQLTQQWRDDRGGWRMTSEQKSGGDAGLLGERPALNSGKEPAPKPLRASFQTRVIRADDSPR